MSKTILQTKMLCKSFPNGGTQQHVLKNLNIEICEKDFTIIMGSSGLGKSTLLYALSSMDKSTLGEVFSAIQEFQNSAVTSWRFFAATTVALCFNKSTSIRQ